MSTQSGDKSSTGRNVGLTILILAALGALLVAAYTVGFDRGKPDKQKAAAPVAPTDGGGGGGEPGKDLFVSSCGNCHVLKAAGTTGTAGPDLDLIKPDAATTATQIQDGGNGMPAGLLEGKDAKEVSDYVASVAGK